MGGALTTQGSTEGPTLNELTTVGTSSVKVLEAQPRVNYTIINTSSAGQVITLNLGFAQAVANKGIVLSPGQGWSDSDGEGYKCHQGVVTAIASAASGQVSVMSR